MKKIPVAAHLTDNEYKILLQTYANHNSNMGLKERTNYTLSDIVRVERNLEEDCLNVYYADGQWWHYAKSGKWY